MSISCTCGFPDENDFRIRLWNIKQIIWRINIRFWTITDNIGFHATISTMLSKKSTNGHYNDVITSAMASQNTSPTIVCSTVYSGVEQRKHQSSASLAFVRGIHRWPVNSLDKGPVVVTRKMFPFDDVIMNQHRFDERMKCTSGWGGISVNKIFT